MILNRTWEMPSRWTFKMKCVQHLLEKYKVGAGWADPFAGLYSPAEHTNDIEPERNAVYRLDALEFLQTLPDNYLTGCIFDPPYSVEQCLRCYSPKYKGTVGRTEYLRRCSEEIARATAVSGFCISFGWDSTGIGKVRSFLIVEILLICHGAAHNDTIVTVDKKI